MPGPEGAGCERLGLRRIAVFLLQILREHSIGINFDELARARRQHFAIAIADLGGTIMFAASHADLPSFDNERFGQWHRFQICDFHPARESDQVVQLVYLAHCLVKDGGDDAPMGVRRRANKAPLQTKATDKALLRFVEDEFQPQSGFAVRTATKAPVGELLLLYLMTMNSLMPGHGVSMKQSCGMMQVETKPQPLLGASKPGSPTCKEYRVSSLPCQSEDRCVAGLLRRVRVADVVVHRGSDDE